jgi:CRP/FNR family transcriptional regulator
LPFNREELASRIGTIREVVSRALSDFEQRGLIELHRRTILILDAEGLSGLSEA